MQLHGMFHFLILYSAAQLIETKLKSQYDLVWLSNYKDLFNYIFVLFVFSSSNNNNKYYYIIWLLNNN